MTAVSLLSSDTVFLQPYREEEKRKAGQAHRRFASREGDLLTLINIYEAWIKVIDIHTIVYCIALNCIVLYCIILCHFLCNYIVPFCMVIYHVILCHLNFISGNVYDTI